MYATEKIISSLIKIFFDLSSKRSSEIELSEVNNFNFDINLEPFTYNFFEGMLSFDKLISFVIC